MDYKSIRKYQIFQATEDGYNRLGAYSTADRALKQLRGVKNFRVTTSITKDQLKDFAKIENGKIITGDLVK